MNDVDRSRIIGLFIAAWPWADWPESTLGLWESQLEPLNADIGAVAARRCVTELERPPALAAFLERYQTERRAATPPVRALEYTSSADPKVNLRRIQTMLTEATRPGEHWHGGPRPCPVCGGIRPDLR